MNKFLAIAIATFIVIGCQSQRSPEKAIANCGDDGEFILIPKGEFIAGSDRTEQDYAYQISAVATAKTPADIPKEEQLLRQKHWFDGEPSRQTISLPDFCIRRNLITNKDYQTFIKETGYSSPGISATDYQKQGFLVHPYTEVQPYLWQNKNYPEGENKHPVVLVSYEDARAFAEWKSQQNNYTYRLPTAQEWEKAARSTDGRYFPWGNYWQNDATNFGGSDRDRTSAIAAYPLSQSPYGVEDMAGNVFEWTKTLTKRGEQNRAILKGCSWDDLPGFCRSAYQHTRPIESRHILFGFRLVRE
ncbi:formylglycine-generating enzyme family protein [Spirulina sp. 06S082]|uniref:formylglycine-generating enzyme family protein n=1 Tax=Spirulina sp. 06S082 TaxID=3110248 RepID=UPI002B21FA24|nr:SUMF1/EgtB/PvdO family nonheme iron enzyme [Spirulina sp. 06S082]MEA5467882.1 SUMF1/EgtB/PvdO family nonheme iron enzyme [Spirulina sp. 06S082]